MKPLYRIALILVLFAALAFPTVALASPPGADPHDDKIVFGSNYTLASGETLDGSLIVFGGNAVVQPNSTVQGDVAVIGGNLDINGIVERNVVIVGGNATLGNSAHVMGNVNTVAAALNRAPGARIDGEIVTGSNRPFVFNPVTTPFSPGFSLGFHPITDFFLTVGRILSQSLALAALAILVILFLPKQVERSADAVTSQPLMSAGLGLLTIVVAPILLVLIMITIILIPVSILGFFALGLAALFGWITIGIEVGKRLGQALNQNWHLAISAGLGTFLMTLVVNSFGRIPCIGWLVPFLVTLAGLGAVVLTRFGTQNYPPLAQVTVPPTPANPPSAPQPPATIDQSNS
jgi:hypothetical protein